ncbi:MAG TPA: tRNA-dihydrouridine synthase [Spirochaetia bacterium]|nr:tRNA-dihydrouridine synthase [Spirochaetia bacterium]
MEFPLGIWGRLVRPFRVLAPMEDVTDTVFRRIVQAAGAPDLFVTEFTSTDGLCSAGRPRVIGRLRYVPTEKPLLAQIWGNVPERYRQVAAELRGMGFDGVDINMGCPVKKVVARGSCSALIKNPSLAAELIAAAREGAGELPVSVKTRIGISHSEAENWLGFLLSQGLAALTVHGRTVSQQSEGFADWSAVALAVRLRDEAGLPTRVVGNGDVRTPGDFWQRSRETGADGIMVGRGIFENVFLFRAIAEGTGEKEFASLQPAEKLAWFQRHIDLHEQTWGTSARFDVLKKFAKTYLRSFEGASRLVDAVMKTRTHAAAREVLASWLAAHAAGSRAPAASAGVVAAGAPAAARAGGGPGL